MTIPLTRKPASATKGGELSDGAQTIAGNKTFSGSIDASGGFVGSGGLATSAAPGMVPAFEQGSYTPMIPGTANVSVLSVETHYYVRVGNNVTVWGIVSSVDAGSGSAQFTLSLPILTNFGFAREASGIALDTGSLTPLAYWVIKASAGFTDRVTVLTTSSGDPTGVDLQTHFSYRILP